MQAHLKSSLLKEIKFNFESFLQAHQIPDSIIPFLVLLALLAVSSVLIYATIIVSQFILKKVVTPIIRKTPNRWDDLLIEHKLFRALAYLVSVIVLKAFVPILFEDFPQWLLLINKLVEVYFVFVIVRILVVFLRATEQHLSDAQIFVEKPLASYFQLFRIVLYIFAFVLSLSILLSKSPLYLLGAFGAMTAVLVLIFKDTILGLVASVQISTNDMLRIGDSIEMPKYEIDGAVTAINLNMIKVRNWDNTITTVPTYYFITESFKNWRGLQTGGGRRIKRALQINIGSIKFLDKDLQMRLKEIALMGDYIDEKQKEIDEYNNKQQVNENILVNGRRMTNIGTFRIYVEKYLQNHPGILKSSSIIVRQNTPKEFGVPIEIYCFTNTIEWAAYEKIQSDIFDHLFAVAPYFELAVFQSPSSSDFQGLVQAKTKKEN